MKENAQFLKDIKDARTIRSRILERMCYYQLSHPLPNTLYLIVFAQANLPILSDIDRRKLLHFCIVGGGPTVCDERHGVTLLF